MKLVRFCSRHSKPIFWAVFLSAATLCIVFESHVYTNDWKVDSPSWEGKTTIGTIKAAMDTYKAKRHGDLSGLIEPENLISQGFGPGSKLLFELRIENNDFAELKYWDPKDFSVELINDGKEDYYIVYVIPSKEKTKEEAGIITYNSQTVSWSDKYNN